MSPPLLMKHISDSHILEQRMTAVGTQFSRLLYCDFIDTILLKRIASQLKNQYEQNGGGRFTSQSMITIQELHYQKIFAPIVIDSSLRHTYARMARLS